MPSCLAESQNGKKELLPLLSHLYDYDYSYLRLWSPEGRRLIFKPSILRFEDSELTGVAVADDSFPGAISVLRTTVLVSICRIVYIPNVDWCKRIPMMPTDLFLRRGGFGVRLAGGGGTYTDAFKNYWNVFVQGFVVHVDKLNCMVWALFLRENFGAIYVYSFFGNMWKLGDGLKPPLYKTKGFPLVWAICKKFPFSGTKFLKGEHWRFLCKRMCTILKIFSFTELYKISAFVRFISIWPETCLGRSRLDSHVLVLF